MDTGILYVVVAYVIEMERKLQSLCMLSFNMSIKINLYSSSFDIYSPGLLCGPLISCHAKIKFVCCWPFDANHDQAV